MASSHGHEVQLIVISLKRSLERRASVDEQLKGSDIEWNYIDAIDSTDVKSITALRNYDRSKRLLFTGYDMSLGEIACFVSHRMAWERCVQTGRTSLILEDDFLLNCKLEDIFQIVRELYDNFDILKLQGTFERKYIIICSFDGLKFVKHFDDPRGAVAYIIKPHGASVLLNNSEHFYMPVDDYVASVWKHKLSVRALIPYPVSTVSVDTTIQDRSKPSLKLYRKIIRTIYRIPEELYACMYRLWVFLTAC